MAAEPHCLIWCDTEQTSLIIDIGEWVLYETCRQGPAWLLCSAAAYCPLSVNISAPQIKRSDLISTVYDVLMATGFPVAQLELKITERSLMETNDSELINDILNNLHALGVRLAIDNLALLIKNSIKIAIPFKH